MEKEVNQNSKPKKGIRACKDLRDFLQQDFLSRLKINPQYSLRAYAQYLGVNSGSLSQIFKGQRPIGAKMAQKFANKLNLTLEQVNELTSQDRQFNQLEVDSFNTLSDWYHFALLELLKTDGFVNELKWIATRLGITITEVNIALERLLRLDLIKKEGQSFTVQEHQLSNLSHLSRDYTNVAFKNYQKQILTKAQSALDNVPLKDRLQTSLSVAVNKEDLEKVKDIIHRCRREINAFLESNPKKQEVYHLSLSLYPVTKDVADKGANNE